MKQSLNTPLVLYEIVYERNEHGDQIPRLEILRDQIFGTRQDLSSRESFEAQKLKYADPRKYALLLDPLVVQGTVIQDEDDYFIVESRERSTTTMVVITQRTSLNFENNLS